MSHPYHATITTTLTITLTLVIHPLDIRGKSVNNTVSVPNHRYNRYPWI